MNRSDTAFLSDDLVKIRAIMEAHNARVRELLKEKRLPSAEALVEEVFYESP